MRPAYRLEPRCAAIRRESDRSPPRWCRGPKLTRMTEPATSGGTPIAASTSARLHLARRAGAARRHGDAGQVELDQLAGAGRAGHRYRADRRLCARSSADHRPPAAAIAASSLRAKLGQPGIASAKAATASAAANPLRPAILGAAAIALLLPAARAQRRDIAHQQRAHAWRPAELVCRDGDEIGVRHRDLAGGLRAIGQQQRSCRADLSARSPQSAGSPRFRCSPVAPPPAPAPRQAPLPARPCRSARRASTGMTCASAPSPRRRRHVRSRDRPAAHPSARRRDRDRLAGAGGQDHVMTPAKLRAIWPAPLRARPAPRDRPRAVSSDWPSVKPSRHRRPRFGQHRGGRGMVEVNPVASASEVEDSCRLPVEAPSLYRSRRRGAPASRGIRLYASTQFSCPK